ncbi:WD repeat and FYVE domain-containing protein 3 [Anopheles ziemanni]|uniref:WD repeat and FYVE domain-containing protein 3 n=1 Tax=Anopheles ziemanni TaxID=345580 RepID=UPI00265EA56A|nr:WD repeat and FYVE domain-containing protein 3 [Anopheles ziemanni]
MSNQRQIAKKAPSQAYQTLQNSSCGEKHSNLSGSPSDGEINDETNLTLLHLCKLFDEFINLKPTMGDTDRDRRLYQMLPLYCNVFSHLQRYDEVSPSGGHTAPLVSWDSQSAFCYHVSRLLAREIKRRASNQSTETASKTIACFLELHDVHGNDEPGNGWILLTAISLMATTNHDSSLHEIMINATLPSTLIRCIYLFLDLPEANKDILSDNISNSIGLDRRVLLYNAFSQILLKLCAHPLAAEELIRMDDLTLLFSTVTAQYAPCNTQWRSLAREVLCTIARHGLNENVIEYVHAKGCMALCLDNMQRTISFKPLDTVEMLLAIFGFLRQSSRLSQVLLDDFKQCQGYLFLVDFFLKIDQDKKLLTPDAEHGGSVAEESFRKLIPMIVSWCSCGYSQAPPLHPLPDNKKAQLQLQGFRMPHVTSKGTCVRNIYAFQVLQTVFLRSTNASLCCTILDAIMVVYRNDDANYFILESQNTLCLFAEKIHQKQSTVQLKFFELIEFIVFQLNFIPRKELIALSVLLKTNQAIDTSITCTRTFLHLLSHNNIFNDVYREVGILEVFTTCMKRYKEFLEKNTTRESINADVARDIVKDNPPETDPQEMLGRLVMEAIVLLLSGNSNNTSVFKNSGGSKCIYEMIKFDHCNSVVLKIVKELVSTAGGEDDMLHLLKSINTTTEPLTTSISMRIHVLYALIDCLKESHRTRSFFRKVGGFVYVVNVLDMLRGQFNDRQSNYPSSKDHIRLFRVVCQTLNAAMRFEPANAKYFQNEIANTLFYQAIQDLGCFSKNEYINSYERGTGNTVTTGDGPDTWAVDHNLVETYSKVFKADIRNDLFRPQMVDTLHYTHNKTNADNNSDSSTASSAAIINETHSSSVLTPTALNVIDNVIVHPSVIVCMLKLLPSVKEEQLSSEADTTIWKSSTTRAIALQYFLSEVIKSFVRSERNQQIMCDGGLNECLLRICKVALVDERHPLHTSLQYIFERLAVQALMPKELRTFLRLNLNIDMCTKDDEKTSESMQSPTVPLTRVKTLVSITTPRDFRAHGSFTQPPFIEMDMSTEGFACLFFPNIAPNQSNPHLHNSTAHHHLHGSVGMGLASMDGGAGAGGAGAALGFGVGYGSGQHGGGGGSSSSGNTSGHQQDVATGGGIGTGDRVFPSNSGLTFSTWFCVDRFPHPPQLDSHPIRLLHIVRSDDGTIEDASVVFSVLILPSDKTLSVATQEFPFTQAFCNVYKDEYLSRVWCPTFLQESQWHHVAVTIAKVTLKSCLLSIYLDGRHVHTQKIQPISTASTTRTMSSCVHAFIGTPPIWRIYSKLNWKQGACHLIDDTFDAASVARVYVLGPHYVGSYQDVRLEDNEEISPLVQEERLMFGVNPKAFSHMTLSKIRKVYNRTDAKAIGKQLGMSSHENATPIVLLHNSSGHLTGPSRTLGGVLVGYLGIRHFNPFPVSMTMNTVGGCSVLLGLVAMSHDIESLYAAVKALTCILRTNKSARREMNRRRYYQTLGMLYKRKKALLNSHILHLTFNLVGTVHSGYETSTIPNITAFQDLLCDFDIWLDGSNDLIRSLLEHLLELGTESNEKFANIRIMQDLQCLAKLLFIIDEITDDSARKALFALAHTLLGYQPRSNDVLLFGQYITSLTPTVDQSASEENVQDRQVQLRNRCLSILHHLHFGANNAINWRLCDDISRILGLDWILMFMQPHLNHSTMLWAMRLLVIMLARESILPRFREGSGGSAEEGYLKNTEVVMQSRNAILLSSALPQIASGGGSGGSNPMGSSDGSTSNKHQVLMGFPYLEWLLLHRIEVPEVYPLLVALIIGYPVKSSIIPSENKSLEDIWGFLWTSPGSSVLPTKQGSEKITFCTEAVCIILSLVRKIVHSQKATDDGTLAVGSDQWLHSRPSDVVRLLVAFYKHLPDFAPIAMSGEVIVALISVLFPPAASFVKDSAGSLSAASTPLAATGQSVSPVLKELDSFDVTPPLGSPVTEDDQQHLITLANRFGNDEICEKNFPYPITAQILDFLLKLVVDSLSLCYTGKTAPVIDAVLEFFLIGSIVDDRQRKHFLTDFVSLLMAHLVSINIMLRSPSSAANSSVNNAAPGGQQHLASNVFYVTARIVDKLWQKMLYLDGREVFDYCIHLIQQAKRRAGQLGSGGGIGSSGGSITCASSLEPLYRSLNRCILYLLAHPPRPGGDAMLVEVLQKLMTNRLLVFGAGNHDPDFIGCLTYCLLQLHSSDGPESGGDRIVLHSPSAQAAARTTTWHVDSFLGNDSEKQIATHKVAHDASTSSLSLSSELVMASFRVWEELYVCKKPVIEEIFKVTLSQPVRNARAPDMDRTQAQVAEISLKHWLAFLDAERRSANRTPWEVHNNIQSKIQKVTGGLTRLTSRSKLKKESGKRRVHAEEFRGADIRQITTAKLTLVRDYWEFRLEQHGNSSAHTKRYVYQDWLQSEAELIRERAIWGPECCADFTKWTLDSTEGPYRMRKKMLKNELFYVHYPPRPELDVAAGCDHQSQRQLKCRVAISHDSGKNSKFVQQYRNMFPEQFEQELAAFITAGQTKTDAATKKSNFSKSHRAENGMQGDCLENEEDLSSSLPDNQVLLRLLEEKEKVSHIFRSARIQGLDTFEGLLLFGRECCYIVDGFTLLRNREIHDIDSLPAENFEPIIPSTTTGNSQMSRSIRQCSKIFYDDIREIHKRRYLLQPIALEVFCGNGQNYLLSFPQKVRNKVFQKLISIATHIADNAQQSVAGQKRAASVEQNAGLLSNLIGETSVTQRWVRGEISNFQYLMHLNSLAGRSYNDLMQYPVFPWILANYDCDTLDLNDPGNFRDLSKPMGAQTQERLKQFQKRYEDWDDPQGDTPPYHYGTHYSSAMIVCSYLVRLEPFTQNFLRLQGGHFDLADRLFHSVKEAWYSASRQNMADVKELIPEFFYLPEFLENSNRFDLGTKQNGEVLNDVVLPPWAKNDPREFIRMHREALECDFVSRNLHLWIDLIFGYKQQGQAAIEAVNVFHHLFYEGNVDIYNIQDPLQKSAAIGFINNFGQIPKQLFRKAHPAKRMVSTKQFSKLVDVSPLIPPLSPLGNAPTISSEKFFFYHLNNLKPSPQPVKEVKGPVGQIIQHEKNILAVEQNKILVPNAYNRYIAWGYADHSIRVGTYDSDRANYVCENIDHCGEILSCTCPSAKLLILAGTSSVLSVHSVDTKAKKIMLKQTLFGHTDTVTALTSSSAYNIILSGSRDRSAIIWDLSRLTYVRKLVGHAGAVAAVSINELTGDIATCSGTWLHIWSINGLQMAVVNTSMGSSDRMQQILCATFSSIREWDTNNVIITGSTDGVVRMWSMEFVKGTGAEESKGNVPAEGATAQETGVLRPSDDTKDNNLQSAKLEVQWVRKLIFRVELTMHTAYDRKDNSEPASITALAISKDHRSLYVGDARGRIFTWSVAEPSFSNSVRIVGGFLGTSNDDSSMDRFCAVCQGLLTTPDKMNTCRQCGRVYCFKCGRQAQDNGILNLKQKKVSTHPTLCKHCWNQ